MRIYQLFESQFHEDAYLQYSKEIKSWETFVSQLPNLIQAKGIDDTITLAKQMLQQMQSIDWYCKPAIESDLPKLMKTWNIVNNYRKRISNFIQHGV